MSGLLDERHFRFLRAVEAGASVGLADREADRIRQKCRREGLAEVLKKPRRWALTERGKNMLWAQMRE